MSDDIAPRQNVGSANEMINCENGMWRRKNDLIDMIDDLVGQLPSQLLDDLHVENMGIIFVPTDKNTFVSVQILRHDSPITPTPVS